ncbi:eukaryotic translation initiation factor 2 subunit 2-like isoform X2 [Ruditapes philippinarum]|uniref:eukaryotic translation initiation factor 2 subunit 2-like isoform X2 n=1 Tax=Ruditapes philippinarum TaxID=129788 RepID=UPI00295BF675|nr:eukaryotic translation initiation factor 2 subunit 2-like isoform X2 [Ruditapes philippinarum]
MSVKEKLPFDPSMKKKKKKKKTGFDPDAVDDAPAEAPAEETATEEKASEAEQVQEKPVDEELSLDFGGLKKKKKKKKMDMDDLKDALPTEDTEEPADDGGVVVDTSSNDADLSLPMKKKKKKKVDFDEFSKPEPDGGEEIYDTTDSDKKSGSSKGKAWVGSDRDYSYDELLTRVFDIIKEKNPEMVTGEKKKIVMRPPQVLRAGARRTSFANFAEISRMLHRQSKHVLAFLLAELGTSGSVDGNNQLIIRGRFNQKQIENVLRRYIKEYVTCHTCKSPDTLLQKEERLFFLQCETCGSRCSVASIKSGFQAVTGRRAAMRANAQ